MNRKKRLVVVTPFLDKSYGTERTVIEWLSNLPDTFEIHVYSQRVSDLPPSKFVLHRIPTLPGPHIFNFLWWVGANHVARFWDRIARGSKHDLIYSPGINCLDADVISVHIVFAEYLRQAGPELRFSRNPVRSWLRLLHRNIYYRLIIALEKWIYSDAHTLLVLYAKKTANDLERFYGRRDPLPVLYLGIDHATYNPETRNRLRQEARAELGIQNGRFVVLMVGNDLRKKGIHVLCRAMRELIHLPVDLIVAGREDPTPFQPLVDELGLRDRVRFLPARKDVEYYYAAADAYAGPSLEDTFALPPAEAMACGLPVIVSSQNGTCEIITHETDGLILQDPTDAATLAAMIRKLYEDRMLCGSLGENAAATAKQYTWERNGKDLGKIFEEVLARKSSTPGHALEQKT
ncbi:MAG: glycosyltransferase family 4 protein [Candidatus Acidiferrales bacterium]